MTSRLVRRTTFALFLALTLTLPACKPAITGTRLKTTGAAVIPASSVVLGKAFLDVPITGATLRILDSSGHLLHEASGATDANGFFSTTLPTSLPKDFRVEISGGLRATSSSTAVLKADVRDFDPLLDRIYVNAATTLVAAKLDLNPQASLKDTQAAVARFLKLPEDISLGIDLANPSLRLFSHASFMTLADGQGSFNAFIASLAGQIAGDATTTYDFSLHSLNDIADAVLGVVGNIALEIGKGALGKVGSTLMGNAIESYFGPDKGQQEITGKIADLKAATLKGFQELDGRIVVLQSSINDVKHSLASLEASMNKQFGRAAYDTKIDAILPSIAAIDTLYYAYLDELRRVDTSAAGKARIVELVQQIQSRVPTALTTIHYALVGTGGGDGAIVQWHRVVGNNNRNGESGNRYPYLVNATFFDQLNDQLDYFEGLQLRGINLLVEARNFKQDPTGAKSDYDHYMANIETQCAAVYNPRLASDVASDVLISPLTGIMWDKTPLANGQSVLFEVNYPYFTTAAITAQITGLRTGAYTDWRMPTMDELYKLGSVDRYRDIFALIQAGFRLQPQLVSTCNGTLSSESVSGCYWYINTSGGLGQAYGSLKRLFVLPARTFKVDGLATL